MIKVLQKRILLLFTVLNFSFLSYSQIGSFYNYAVSSAQFVSGSANLTLLPLYPDSTLNIDIGTGVFPWNIHSIASVFEPRGSVFGTNAIPFNTFYTVDSISFSGRYHRGSLFPLGIVDTLIVEVGVLSSSTATYSFTNPMVDGFKSVAYNYLENTIGTIQQKHIIKIPLDDAFYADSTLTGFHITKLALPSAITVIGASLNNPAAYRQVLVTSLGFKPGYTPTAGGLLLNYSCYYAPIIRETVGSPPYYESNLWNMTYVANTDVRYNISPSSIGWNGQYLPRLAFQSGIINEINLSIDYKVIGDCNSPSNLTANAVVSSEAILSWNKGGTESQWNVQYGSPGFSLGNGTTVVSNNHLNFVISGLSASTPYEVYVQANCVFDTSAWIGPISFNTPACSNPTNISFGNFTNSSVQVSWIGSSDNVLYNVEIGANGFTIGSGIFATTTSSQNFTFTGLIQGNSYDFYIQGGCTGDSTLWLGPFIFTMPTCIAPNNINVFSTSPTTADVVWIADASNLSWIVEYGLSGFSIGSGSIMTSNNTQIQFAGLLPSTYYDVYVRANCGADSSIYSGVTTFSTQVAPVLCTAPTNVSTNLVSNTSTSVSWQPTMNINDVFDYLVSYGSPSTPFSNFNHLNVQGANSTLISGLTYQEIYHIYIMTNCVLGDTSNRIGPFVFTAGVTSTNFEENNYQLNIYPNPSKSIANIDFNLNFASDLTLNIYDLSGKLIDHTDYGMLNSGQHTYKVDVSQYQTGLYFFELISNQGRITKKISILK